MELGWIDFLAACKESPIVRCQGRVYTRNSDGRMKRFNRALRVIPDTEDKLTVEAVRVKFSRKLGIWLDTAERMTINWSTLDWVSWKASGDPNGTWAKVTVTGRSNFGYYEVRGSSVVDMRDMSCTHHTNRGLAVIAAMRKVS